MFIMTPTTKTIKGKSELNKIQALILNKERNQLVLMMSSPPNELIYSTEAVEAAKMILAVLKHNVIPVYELPVKDLYEYVNDDSLPLSEYICNGYESESESDDDTDEEKKSHQKPLSLKKDDTLEVCKEVGDLGLKCSSSVLNDDVSTVESDDLYDRVQSENNRLIKEK